MKSRDGSEWEQPMHSVDVTAAGFDAKQAVALRVPAGSAVFFTGMTVHGSYANTSGEPRRAFATHYMDEGSWVERCDLQSHVSVDEVAAGLSGRGASSKM
jgi:ectoine hydroxylase-related dioxygenase (phytanoyl-CoA dioxygenase family)